MSLKHDTSDNNFPKIDTLLPYQFFFSKDIRKSCEHIEISLHTGGGKVDKLSTVEK